MTSSKKKIQPETYHEIFLPFPDVYHMGGSEVFTNLAREESEKNERNLIVLPVGYSDKLGLLEENEQSEGSASTLKFINSSKENKYKTIESDSFGCRITIYRLSNGLDLAYVDDQKFAKEQFNMGQLKDLVNWFTRTTNSDNVPLKLITNIQSNHLKYDSRGFVVEEPGFLQVNEDIVNQGIITGTPELQARLNTKSDKPLSLEEAVQFLSGKREKRELYINQFIRFPGSPSKQQFAVVRSEFAYNKSGDRIIGLKNPRVELLHPQENGMKIHIK